MVVFIAPNNKIRYITNILTKYDIGFKVIKTIESSTLVETGFTYKKIFSKTLFSTINDFLDLDDGILQLVLCSIKKEDYLKRVEDIASSNQIFVIDFNDINV